MRIAFATKKNPSPKTGGFGPSKTLYAEEKDVCWDAPPLVAVARRRYVFFRVNLRILSQILWLKKEHPKMDAVGCVDFIGIFVRFSSLKFNKLDYSYIRLIGLATTPPAISQAGTEKHHHLQVRFISSSAILSKFQALNFRVHVVFQHG